MTDHQAEAQAALDAVRARMKRYFIGAAEVEDIAAILAALENLDARLKALEGRDGQRV